MLKVALINNMNNNFFSLQRYLRDRNFDVHLFQVDELDAHFFPECDTFNPYDLSSAIHVISQINFRQYYTLALNIKKRRLLNNFEKRLKNFDIIIGCGQLAVLNWASINLDIFIPHGGDLYQSPFMFDYCIKKHFPYSMLMRHYIKRQRQAIYQSRAIIALASIDRHMHDALIKLKEPWIDWPIPMVYPLQIKPHAQWEFMSHYDFILFSHTRQGWKTALDYKGNDRAIRAFARFVKEQTHFHHPLLVLFEYGPDVDASKTLIQELHIEKYVRWMPTMPRKYIYEGLKKSSLVFDFFHDEVVSFGGVTFEAFCQGKPVIGNAKLAKVNTNHSLPLVHAFSEEEIFHVLMDYGQRPNYYHEQGKMSQQWFHKEVGNGLADRYATLIEYMSQHKSHSLRHRNIYLKDIMHDIHDQHC